MARASSKPKALYAQCMTDYSYKNFRAFLTEITRFLNSIPVNPYLGVYQSIVSDASDQERLQFLTCIMSINDGAPRREYLGEVLRLNLPGAVELLIQMAKNNQFPCIDIKDEIDTRETCLNILREVNPAAALGLLCEPNMHQKLGTSLNTHMSQLTAVNNSYLITLLDLETIQNALTAYHLDNFLEQALALNLRGAAKLLGQPTILQKLPAVDWIARVQQARNSDDDGIRQEVEEIFSKIFPTVTGRASMARAPTDSKSRRAAHGLSIDGLTQTFSPAARLLNQTQVTPTF